MPSSTYVWILSHVASAILKCIRYIIIYNNVFRLEKVGEQLCSRFPVNYTKIQATSDSTERPKIRKKVHLWVIALHTLMLLVSKNKIFKKKKTFFPFIFEIFSPLWQIDLRFKAKKKSTVNTFIYITTTTTLLPEQ